MNNQTKNNQLLAIKVGGSFITDKTKPLTTLPERISLFASELHDLHKSHPDIDLLVANGAGSFAHFSAHKYGLSQGAKTAEQYYGMCLAHNEVRQLNGILTDAMTHVGLSAFGLSPSSLFMSEEGIATTSYFDPVKYLLANDTIPVLHGDTILDTKLGTRIFSSEEAIRESVERLRGLYARITVVYLLSVDGLLDKEGTTIPVLRPHDEVFVRNSLDHDVTGGIVGKIKSARKVAETVDEVFLINGTIPGELQRVMTAGNVGTKIERP